MSCPVLFMVQLTDLRQSQHVLAYRNKSTQILYVIIMAAGVSRHQKGTRSSAIAEGPRDASCQLKSCQLPRNSAETTYITSSDQIDGMKLEI